MPRERAPLTPAGGWAIGLAVGYLGLLLLSLHGSALGLPFLADDYFFLTDRQRGIVGSLVHGYTEVPAYFRPVGRELYFWIVGWIAGANPLVFHLANLTVLLATLAVVARIAYSLAGIRAALIAAGAYALFYPHRVQLGYVSCSQDLLATALGCGAVLAYLGGRRWWSAGCFFLAMLSKESVAALPLVLAAWERFAGEKRGRGLARAARQTGPLWLALLAWGALVPLVRHGFGWLDSQPGNVPIADVAYRARDFVMGLAFTLLTYVGAEHPWTRMGKSFPPLPPLVASIALAALFPLLAWALARWRSESEERAGASAAAAAPAPPLRRDPEPRALLVLGLAWAILGALPVAVVGVRFSAYYASFSAVGFALVLASLLARRPLALAIPVFALLAGLDLGANAGTRFRLNENDRQAPPGLSITNDALLRLETAYVRAFQAFLRAHPLGPHPIIYLSQPFGFSIMGTGGVMGPRIWHDDPGLEVRFLSGYHPGADGDRPRLMVRVDPDPPRFAVLSDTLVGAILAGEAALNADDAPAARVAMLHALGLCVPGEHDGLRASILQNLGVAADRMGDSTAARQYWLEVVRLSPRPPYPALFNLGALEADAGHFAEARRWIVRALEASPGDSFALDYLRRLDARLAR
jgi:tetratricopeptide (TPR) repeat protein